MTGEPVGSRKLSRLLPMSLSPASVRNVMSDLEDQGLILAPHVSAGRLPTEAGLRFFVDGMLEIGDLSAEEEQAIEARIRGGASDRPVEALLAEASEALSGLSQGAGVVLAGKADLRLKHIEFIRLEPTRALVVLIGEDGTVENRLIKIDAGTTPSSLTEAANFLNTHLRGRSLSEAREDLESRQAIVRAELDRLTERIIETGLASWAEVGEGQPETLIVRGQANLLDNLNAAEDLERVRLLFDDLESPEGVDQPAHRRRDRRGCSHLHRLREQIVFALWIVDRGIAVPRLGTPRGWGSGCHRTHKAELCAHRAGG